MYLSNRLLCLVILETAYGESFQRFPKFDTINTFHDQVMVVEIKEMFKLSVIIKKNFSQTYGEKIYFVYRNDGIFRLLLYEEVVQKYCAQMKILEEGCLILSYLFYDIYQFFKNFFLCISSHHHTYFVFFFLESFNYVSFITYIQTKCLCIAPVPLNLAGMKPTPQLAKN